VTGRVPLLTTILNLNALEKPLQSYVRSVKRRSNVRRLGPNIQADRFVIPNVPGTPNEKKPNIESNVVKSITLVFLNVICQKLVAPTVRNVLSPRHGTTSH
jgi:hypothetical protein